MDQHKKLFPRLTTKERENMPNIVYISRVNSSTQIEYKIINYKNKQIIENQFDGIDLQQFLETFSFDNVKALILNIFGPDYDNFDVENNVHLRENISTKLRSIKVPHLFVNESTFTAMDVLISANAVFQKYETVLIISMSNECFHVVELWREKLGYDVYRKSAVKCADNDILANFEQLRTEILGKNNPTKIIVKSPVPLCMPSKLMDILTKNILTSESLIICVENETGNEKAEKAIAKVACTIVRNMYDSSFTTFRIFPSCRSSYFVFQKQPAENSYIRKIQIHETVQFPIQSSESVLRSEEPFYICYFDKKNKKPICIKTAQFNPYRNAITEWMELKLFIDENEIPHLYCESKSEGEEMILTCEIPVIGFFRNRTYIRLKKDNSKEHDFLETWSDRFGRQTFLSFEEEKPKVVTVMDETCILKSVIKVHDIIKVMSMPIDEIVIDPTWNFGISNDPENPLLITFCNFDGNSSGASPAFLMALILKHFLKILRQDTQIKVEQIGLYLIDKKEGGEFSEEEKERIENGFEEACKLMKVEYFSAADVSKCRSMSGSFWSFSSDFEEIEDYMFKL